MKNRKCFRQTRIRKILLLVGIAVVLLPLFLTGPRQVAHDSKSEMGAANVLPNYELNRRYKDEGKGKLYKTTDGGKAWTILGRYDGFAIYIEPNYPDVMLMSTRDGGNGL